LALSRISSSSAERTPYSRSDDRAQRVCQLLQTQQSEFLLQRYYRHKEIFFSSTSQLLLLFLISTIQSNRLPHSSVSATGSSENSVICVSVRVIELFKVFEPPTLNSFLICNYFSGLVFDHTDSRSLFTRDLPYCFKNF